MCFEFEVGATITLLPRHEQGALIATVCKELVPVEWTTGENPSVSCS